MFLSSCHPRVNGISTVHDFSVAFQFSSSGWGSNLDFCYISGMLGYGFGMLGSCSPSVELRSRATGGRNSLRENILQGAAKGKDAVQGFWSKICRRKRTIQQSVGTDSSQKVKIAKTVKTDNVPCHIEQGLYPGSVFAACNKTKLLQLNVTYILVVAKNVKMPFPCEFKYLHIDVDDHRTVDLLQYFDTCSSFIDEGRKSGGSVLVHCYAGISRSVTVVLGYLMRRHALTVSQALELVRAKRPQELPNRGFMSQLHSFEKTLQDMTAAIPETRTMLAESSTERCTENLECCSSDLNSGHS